MAAGYAGRSLLRSDAVPRRRRPVTSPAQTCGDGGGYGGGAGHVVPGPSVVRRPQPTMMVNELVVPVAGTEMSNRCAPLSPAGTVKVTVALPISSSVGV